MVGALKVLPVDCLCIMLEYCHHNEIIDILTMFEYITNEAHNEFITQLTSHIIKTIPNAYITNDMAKMLIRNHILKRCDKLEIWMNIDSFQLIEFMKKNYVIILMKQGYLNECCYEYHHHEYIIKHNDSIYQFTINTNNNMIFDYELYKLFQKSFRCWYEDDHTYYYDNNDHYLHEYIRKYIKCTFLMEVSNIHLLMNKCFNIIYTVCWYIKTREVDCYFLDIGRSHYMYDDEYEDNDEYITRCRTYFIMKDICVYLYGSEIVNYLDQYLRKFANLPIISDVKFIEIYRSREFENEHEHDEYKNNGRITNKRLKKINTLKKNFTNYRDFKIFKKMYVGNDIKHFRIDKNLLTTGCKIKKTKEYKKSKKRYDGLL